VSPRCPYCHAEAPAAADAARCPACRAAAHPACALELGRCAACGAPALIARAGPRPGDGWRPAPAGGEAAYVRLAPPTEPDPDVARPTLRLELPAARAPADGVLAGEAVVVVPRAEVIGRLELVLEAETASVGLLGRLRRRRREAARVVLLGPRPRPGRLGRLLGGRPRGVWGPGRYAVAFRLPLTGLPPTEVSPGARRHRRARLRLVLDRRGGPLAVACELTVTASDAGAAPGAPGTPRIRVEPAA